MHTYILTRGIKHDVDRFITELQGKYLPYEFEKGKQGLVQFAVRPIQLWELVFPEPQLQSVMKTLFENTTRHGLSYSHRNDKYLWALRKALNASKFPELDAKALAMPIYKNNIEVAGIGIKKDQYKNDIEML
jgi:hypothetical protein